MEGELWLLFIRTAIKPWPCAAYCVECHVPLHDKCADPVHVRGSQRQIFAPQDFTKRSRDIAWTRRAPGSPVEC